MTEPLPTGPAGSTTEVVDRVRETGAVAILRLREHGSDVAVGQALLRGGLVVMEVTLDHPDGVDSLRRLAAELPEPALVGAGTVTTVAQVTAAAEAGARFCVSPHTDPVVIAAALDAGLEPLPGAATPTEVAAARAAGARLIKLFPAGPLGLGYLRALRGPFHDVTFVPTGGIRHDEVDGWLRGGAVAVGLGSDLVPPRPGAADLSGIEERARTVARLVRVARTPED
ncbi:bifunctional 4-hydroxy-2-oxoglutarate aldolase/2-dehydro-3-deoxy-phosphogluconate aldolase [Plantactinospora sp. GCM10030261]|uniref:bifunctional 4-hydroxy-2-oxoglutarate aldolase/2-dehydro-3-deoxy-phosphogluconate aldolase n=1 Tax=Plantactinospora sp. GCM10030261 TaxID=3273420 RepID=UPI003620024A